MIATERHDEGDWFIVKAGNPGFNGERLGLVFARGVARTSDPFRAKEFACNLGRTESAEKLATGQVVVKKRGYVVTCPEDFDLAKSGWVEDSGLELGGVSPLWEKEDSVPVVQR